MDKIYIGWAVPPTKGTGRGGVGLSGLEARPTYLYAPFSVRLILSINNTNRADSNTQGDTSPLLMASLPD